MKNPFIYLFALLMSVVSLTSCSSDDDNGSVSREIRYEITGDFSGEELDVTYTVNNGATNAEVTSLPWSYTYTAEGNTAGGASLSAGGFGAVPGEKITIKIFQGNTQKASVEGTANSDGIVAVVANAYFN